MGKNIMNEKMFSDAVKLIDECQQTNCDISNEIRQINQKLIERLILLATLQKECAHKKDDAFTATIYRTFKLFLEYKATCLYSSIEEMYEADALTPLIAPDPEDDFWFFGELREGWDALKNDFREGNDCMQIIGVSAVEKEEFILAMETSRFAVEFAEEYLL